jgi:hypothetical protein
LACIYSTETVRLGAYREISLASSESGAEDPQSKGSSKKRKGGKRKRRHSTGGGSLPDYRKGSAGAGGYGVYNGKNGKQRGRGEKTSGNVNMFEDSFGTNNDHGGRDERQRAKSSTTWGKVKNIIQHRKNSFRKKDQHPYVGGRRGSGTASHGSVTELNMDAMRMESKTNSAEQARERRYDTHRGSAEGNQELQKPKRKDPSGILEDSQQILSKPPVVDHDTELRELHAKPDEQLVAGEAGMSRQESSGKKKKENQSHQLDPNILLPSYEKRSKSATDQPSLKAGIMY